MIEKGEEDLMVNFLSVITCKIYIDKFLQNNMHNHSVYEQKMSVGVDLKVNTDSKYMNLYLNEKSHLNKYGQH